MGIRENVGSGFRDVDATTDPSIYIKYLSDRASGPDSQLNRLFLVSLLGLNASDRVLDIGCGLGDDARMIAKVLTEGGSVAGVDRSWALISEARRRSEGSDLPVDFLVGDAHHLAFSESSFDCCVAERVFQHLADPRQTLGEIIRLTKPGGRVLVTDPDWGTLTVDSSDRNLTLRITQAISDRVIRNGWVGRQLAGMFVTAGLIDVEVFPSVGVKRNHADAWHVYCLAEGVQEAVTTGCISSADATRWIDELEAASRVGRFFASLSGFAVLGRKSR